MQGKDQQNIKRRVYDALNVLIALGILKKEGRKIVGERRTKKSSLSAAEEYQLLTQRESAELRNLMSKSHKLDELKGKYNVIKNLIERNKKSQGENPDIIRFPFIGTVVSGELKEVLLSLSQSNIDFNGQKLSLKSNKKLKPFGDVDSLNFLPEEFKFKDLKSSKMEEEK